MPWYIIILFSAFMLGLYAIFQKKGLKKSDPISFTFLISLAIALYSIPILLFENPFIFDTQTYFLLGIKSLSASAFFILAAKALKHMEISEFSPLMNLSPLILLIMSYFILGERVGLAALLGIFLIVAGSYVLELKDGLLSPIKSIIKSKYIHLLVLGLLFASLCAVIDRYILNGMDNLWPFFFLNNWLILIALSFYLIFQKNAWAKLNISLKTSAIWIIFGSVIYMIGDYAYFSGLMIPAALVALAIPLKRLSTLFSTVIGGEIFHEQALIRKTIACVIMIAGVYLIVA